MSLCLDIRAQKGPPFREERLIYLIELDGPGWIG